MKKQKRTGTCVYCLRESVPLTKDHIFPRTWYPDSTPPTTEKWVVPACSECNHRYGVIEQELLIRFGLCLNPQSPESSGIPQRASRAFDQKSAKNERDRKARLSLRKRVRRDMFTTKNPQIPGILPNFGPQAGLDYGGNYRAIGIPRDQLEELCRKFVRGLIYKRENGRLITSDNTIEIYLAEDTKVSEFIELIERFGVTEDRGPGVKIQRAVGSLEKVGALFRITIWDRLIVYAVVLPSSPEIVL